MTQHIPRCWAKLGKEKWPDKYHPVICHLIDVGQAAAALWQHVVRQPMKQHITEALGLPEEDAARRWLAFWIAAHDIGKLTPCFQLQGNTDKLKEQLETAGFLLTTCGNPHHTETGTKILHSAFTQGKACPKLDDPLARKIAVAVGGHHGTFPSSWEGHCDSLGNEKWYALRQEVFEHISRLFGVNDQQIPRPTSDDQSVWMYLAGLTSVADWIGSNTEFFESKGNSAVADQGLDIDDYFCNSGNKAANALEKLGWRHHKGVSDTLLSFEKATGIGTPRPLQDAIIPIATEMKVPQLVIVEAPMGEGKTEAAWYIADCWDRRGGQGTYVALPTMATSNQMFGRVASFLETEGEGKKNLILQHGKASLNDRFEMLKYAAWVYDEEKHPAGVVAESWFAANKKHGLLAPYGVGTIDQALLAVLQTKHVFVRLFGLAGKCVILDEVHAYDAYMTTLMERLLRWLAALGCPVVLLSATLPAEKRAKLIEAYSGTTTTKLDGDNHYPRVTFVRVQDGTPVVICFPAAGTKEIHLDWVEDHDLPEKLRASLSDGGCAAVIRNTVGLAQETFTRLKEDFKGTDVVVELFHARFPFGRRKQIEDAVLAKFGKGTDGKPENPLRPKKAILVATQVIEQSLDLDFDVMFTDVAPVDLVLQRAGRLHRHERSSRPGGDAKLWLIEPGKRQKDGLPDFGPSEWVYSRFVLLKSYVALKAKTTVSLPDDLEHLVEQIYGKESMDTPEHYQNDLAESEKAMREEQRMQNRAAKGVMIWTPEMDDLLEQPNQQLEEDDPEAHKKVQAATRDTEPTVQLILVYQLDGNDFLDPYGKDPFDESKVPDVKRLRQLLNNEVTISHKGCVFHYVKQPVPSGWKKCGMLKHHRIVRIDQDGSSLTDDRIRLDTELGVIIYRNREGEGA